MGSEEQGGMEELGAEGMDEDPRGGEFGVRICLLAMLCFPHMSYIS